MLCKTQTTYGDKYVIVSDDETITYNVFFEKARFYQTFFQRNNVKKVCIVLDRSILLYSLVLGAVLSGSSYSIYEVKDLNAISKEKIKKLCPDLIISNTQIEELDNVIDVSSIKGFDEAFDKPVQRNEDDYLYYVSTSGTTGTPKIIGTKDKNFLCYIKGYIKAFSLTSEDVFFQQSPVFYDGFAEEFFAALLLGATLAYTKTENLKSPVKLIEQLNRHKVTVFPSTPIMINEIDRRHPDLHVKKIVSSGDILKNQQINWLLNNTDIQIYNMYGLSETTVCATYHLCQKSENDEISIGKPLEGYSIYLFDENMEPAKQGEPGEIYIAGDGVIESYYTQDSDNNNILTRDNQIMFRTGDYAWKDQNEELHFIGRNDRIVKNKGNRINLNEIEAVLLKHEEIKNVVALFDKEKQLLKFFYVSDTLDDAAMRDICKNNLLPYMMPNQLRKIDEIPITATGKIDYVYLEQSCSENQLIETSDNSINAEIKKIICKTLEVNEIDDEQSLEDIGIESFSYLMLLVDLEQKWDTEMGEELLILNDEMSVKEFCSIVERYINEKNV